MNRSIQYILGGLLLFCTHFLVAQDELPTGEVDVINNFNARLLDTEPFTLSPILPPLDTSTRRQTYNILTRAIEVAYPAPKIRPLRIRKAEKQNLYNGHFMLGGGLPNAAYMEGSYFLDKVENFDFRVHAFHHSANNNKQVENQRFGWNDYGLEGTYYLNEEGVAVNGKMNYSHNASFFYGYNDLNEELPDKNFSFESGEVRQRVAIFDIGASLFNGARTILDFNYKAGFDVYILQDNFATRERGFNLELEGTKWFNESHPLTIKLVTDFTTYKNEESKSLNNFFLQPSYTYHGDIFKVKIGANIASHEDEFTFFPDLEATANIAQDLFGVYVGAEGSLRKNTFRELNDYNPFIESRIDVRNTSYYRFYGGIKGNIQGIDYDGQLAYQTAENLALYQLSDPLDSIARFDVLYDTATIFTIKGSASAPLFPGFALTGTVSQHIYSLDNQEKAWHLPAFSLNVGAAYTTMEDRLRLTGDFYLENGVPFRDSNGEAQNLNALFDVSVGAELFFTDNIGGFVKINNLANNTRQRFQRYPVMGLNALFGISARF
ncbi:MAG: hypothetical protein HRU41_16710 [Saprospiraceae bacterium]|nr:hypothetical protein [Saprospiraceae bacterium]